MSWSKIMVAGVLGATLSACGGGGGASTSQQSSAPKEFTRLASTLGDFQTERSTQVVEYPDGAKDRPLTEYATRFVSDQNSTTTTTTNTVDSAGSTRGKSTFDTNSKLVRTEFLNGCAFDYLPAYNEGLPVTSRLDTSWDLALTRNYSCINSSGTTTDQLSFKGKVLGQETVTVQAGTFETIKYTSTLTRRRATSTLVIESTCWVEPNSGINVKCEILHTDPQPPSPLSMSSVRIYSELVAYSHAASQRKKFGVERFAGDWTGAFKGNDQGNCTFRIELTGELGGSCQSNGLGGTINLTGSVDANGSLKFILSSNGISTPAFTGTLESPGNMSGSWLLSTGGGGTWFMQHK